MNDIEQDQLSRRSGLKIGAVGAGPLVSPGSLLANSPSDITSLTALELSSAIRSRHVSCVEVMSTFLSRIDKVNPAYNAIVSRQDESSLMAQAKSCDLELSAGNYRGWMHGMPHAAKDLADVEGMITTSGSPVFRNNVATADSLHIARIRQAGIQVQDFYKNLEYQLLQLHSPRLMAPLM